jgi:PAS domain S-box-containing protein
MPPLTVRPSLTSTLALEHDWAATPLGPLDQWPPALRVSVQTCLNSQFPMCMIWGPELTQIYNDGYIPILGAKHPAMFGRPVRESWPEIRDFLEESLRSVMATGHPLWFEDQPLALTKGQAPEECYFTFSYSPLFDDRGTAHGLLSVAYETTRVIVGARRQHLISSLRPLVAEAPSVDEMWTRMHAAFDTSNPDTARVALFEWRRDTARPELLWTEGDALPESPWPPSADVVTAPLSGQAAGGRPRAATSARVPVVDGTRIRLVPLRGWPGDLRAVLAVEPGPLVVTDSEYDELLWQLALTVEERVHNIETVLTHISAVQAELSNAEVRYRSLFESTHDGVLYSAPDGSVHGANPAACALLGYTEAELMARDRSDLFFPGDEDLVRAIRIRRETGQYSGELTFRHKDGTPLRVDLSSTIFIDTAGEERVVTIFRDVTERRRLEARAQDMRRMDTLGQLTGGVAHDFNNLLTVIMGATDALQPGAPSSEIAESAETIQQATSRAAALTKQLLAFARRQPLHSLPTDLNALITQIESLLRRALSEAVSTRFERGERLWPAQADPAQLEVAVLNLALNARDAMPAGGTLTIGTRNRTVASREASEDLPAGDYVELFVSDTGTGMPPEVVSRACEPFFTTKATGQGTGLGLSMVYGVVRQLGGSLSIDSAVGEGTTVRLLLPRAMARAVGARADTATVPHAAPGEVVLAVEDNDLLRPLVQSMLQRLGYEVILAGTADEALALLDSEQRVDLLFTDVVMPGGMDGRQLARRVRARRPAIGVLLTSGYMNPHTVATATADEAQEPLLPKPYQTGPLARAVRAALDGRDPPGD